MAVQGKYLTHCRKVMKNSARTNIKKDKINYRYDFICRDFIHAVYTGYLPKNMKIMNNVFMVAKLLKVQMSGQKLFFYHVFVHNDTNLLIYNYSFLYI